MLEKNQANKKNSAEYSTRQGRLPAIGGVRPPDMKGAAAKLKNNTVALLAGCALIGFGGGWLGSSVYSEQQQSPSNTANQQRIISNEGELISTIARDVGQSVVSIEVESQASANDFFGFSAPTTSTSAGTGFIVSSDGVVVTNRHVVRSQDSSITITMADGTKYSDVRLLGRTADSTSLDIAFLKIEGLGSKKLIPVELGDSSKTEVGDRVIAIGNALGQFKNTVTSGIISGYGRDVTASDGRGISRENLNDLFQTDAAINEGNSGGPLVNINGEVIGVNTAVASGAQNIGFAIPINDVKGLIDTVLVTGELKQPYLGVRYVTLTDDIAYEYNLDVNRGAYIMPSPRGASIIAGSPAEKAGIREKDIITKINDIEINEKTSLSSALSRYKVGNSIRLTIVRGDQTLRVNATLEAIPNS